MHKILVTIFSTSLILATTGMLSCSEELNPTPYTFSEKFTGKNNKTWKVKFLEITVDGDVVRTIGISCAIDDQHIFYANSERAYQVYTGNRKCAAEGEEPEPDLISDSWAFSNATATLTIVVPFLTPNFRLPFFVREVDDNEMELEFFLDEANTESYRLHFEAIDEE